MTTVSKAARILAGTIFVTAALSTAAPAVPALENDDPLLLADLPIYKGEADFINRIEQPISGRDTPLGLLLSGGSARAFAHIGVLQRLEEAGYAPDFIVTNSMGSIVGLLYGAGLSPDTILELFLSFELSSLFEPEFPLRGGVLNPGNFIELVEELIPYDDISELPIPVAVVCEDLRSKRRVVLTEGDFSTVLAASFALPFYFPPQNMGELRLIDGGVTNLAPLAIPYRYSDAVMVSTTFYQKELNLSNPITNLNVAMDIGKSRHAVSNLKQFNPIWIRCNVESFSFMDWSSIEEIVARGYESADRILRSSVRLAEISAVEPRYLHATREVAHRRVARETTEYRRSGMAYVEPSLTGARIGIQLADGPYEQPLFSGRNRFTAGVYLKRGYFDANLKLFYQPQFLNRYQMIHESFTGTALDFTWMPGRRVRFTGFNDLHFTVENSIQAPVHLESTHSAGELFIPLQIGPDMVGGPTAGIELTTDENLEPNTYQYFGGLKAETIKPGGFIQKLETSLAMNHAEEGAFQAEIAVKQRIIGPLHLVQRLFTRLPLTHSTQVAYYPSDFYTPLTSPEQIKHLLISNTHTVLDLPGFQPTFGETMIMEELSIGPFFDLRETGNTSLNYAVGGGVRTAFSLLGLKPILMRMDAGWSFDAEEWFFSFTLWS
jgi:predicted acylesterase/phospholipase RssA